MNRNTIHKSALALLLIGILFMASACGKAPAEETIPSTAAITTTAPTEATEVTTVPTETVPTVPTETEPTEERFILTFAGDCTLGCMPMHEYTSGGFPNIVGEDYKYPFANVIDYFENDDFTMVNFEGTLGNEGYAASKTFTFRGRAEYTNILTVNSVEAVTLANNHTLDFGYQGYTETKRLLSEAGVPFVEKDSSTLFTTESGLTIGLYAAAFVVDQKDLEAEVTALREQGAEVVIFAIHWGTEGSYYPYVDQSKVAYKAIDAGVDIVYGHHPHVLQKIEEYNGGIIFYSLGNFCFGGNQQPGDLDTALLQQEIIRDPDGSISLGELTIVPCSISSVPVQNNYQPTPYAEGSADYERVLEKLSGKWNGKNFVPVYDAEAGTPTTSTTPTTPSVPSEGTAESGGGTESGGTETPPPTPDPTPTPDPAPDPGDET